MGYSTEVQITVHCTVYCTDCTVYRHCTLQGPGVPELRGPQQHAQLGGVQAALHRRDGGQREKDWRGLLNMDNFWMKFWAFCLSGFLGHQRQSPASHSPGAGAPAPTEPQVLKNMKVLKHIFFVRQVSCGHVSECGLWSEPWHVSRHQHGRGPPEAGGEAFQHRGELQPSRSECGACHLHTRHQVRKETWCFL